MTSEDPRVRRDFSSTVNTDEETSMGFPQTPSSLPDLPFGFVFDFNNQNGNHEEENPTDGTNNTEIGGISSDDVNESCQSSTKEAQA